MRYEEYSVGIGQRKLSRGYSWAVIQLRTTCSVLLLTLVALVSTSLFAPLRVSAFCGFYVGGADSSLYNDATMVVMMRDGHKTVLSMQNSYQGPPSEFAMVIPVPTLLTEENVKTLPQEVFSRVDRLAAPRLVSYWERDPCAPPPPEVAFARMMVQESGAAPEETGVTVEAEFTVAEYEVVILSARDSSGLDRWLRRNDYNIPEGAETVLRSYVEDDMKFFVAKVNPERVRFEDGRAILSPLRVEYESETFSLPVRLGMLNSSGQQDLIVHVLARRQRYEVANYDNVTIPTNIKVRDAVGSAFGPFYDALFSRTIEQHPRTVVTEYSWDATSCDPCPDEPLNEQELATLGQDTIGGDPYGFVLTRLHYRYGADDLGEDLVFRAAPPIVGGRGTPNADGDFTEEGASPGDINNFQGRYAILHRWDGAVTCDQPSKGHWGGPPGGRDVPPQPARNQAMTGSAGNTAPLGAFIAEAIPSLDLTPGEVTTPNAPPSQPPPATAPATARRGGCAGCAVDAPSSAGMFPLLVVGFLLRRRGRII